MSSPWIDVAVAVAFVFFVFSMIVSALNEVINWVGQVRSKQLWSTLHRLSSTAAGFGVVDDRTDRQLASRIYSFATGLRETFFRLPTGRAGSDHRPLLRPDGDLTAIPALLSMLRSTSALRSLETADGGRTAIRHVPPDLFADAVVELGADGGLAGALAGISPLRRKLEDLQGLAATDVAAFRAAVSSWFDGQMTQLSHRYRKDVRRVMFALGLVVAVFANVNAINVVASAQRDSDLRQALVADAGQVGAGDAALCPTGSADGQGRLACLRDQIARARSLRITTFWGLDGPCRDGRPCSSWWERATNVIPSAWDKVVDHPLAAAGRLLGWLLAGIALSFGGAFWFDLLRRAVGYRRALTRSG